MPQHWAGGWASSVTQCLPTCRGGTSDAYLAPTASLLWDLSGTRRARWGRVVSRSGNGERTGARRGDAEAREEYVAADPYTGSLSSINVPKLHTVRAKVPRAADRVRRSGVLPSWSGVSPSHATTPTLHPPVRARTLGVGKASEFSSLATLARRAGLKEPNRQAAWSAKPRARGAPCGISRRTY
jgi:hypothetical protein